MNKHFLFTGIFLYNVHLMAVDCSMRYFETCLVDGRFLSTFSLHDPSTKDLSRWVQLNFCVAFAAFASAKKTPIQPTAVSRTL